jgi:predicted DNA-binding protein (MmcQ/YjbR family)
MNIEEFREYCLLKKGVTEGTPFGPDVLVLKVMGKMFALTDIDNFESINLKCDPDRAIELREEYSSITPGYHMNKKHWNTILSDGSISDDHLRELIDHSYDLVVSSLTKSLKQELQRL